MDNAIIPISMIQDSARCAFFAGRVRDSHGMNPGSAALPHWLAEFDRLTAASKYQNSLLQQGRFDVAQESA